MCATRRMGSWLLAASLLLTVFGCAQPGAPTSPPQAAPDAAAIDAEAAAIRAGAHTPVPKAVQVERGGAAQVAVLRSKNDTPHVLEVLYSGSTSQRLRMNPGQQGQVSLQPGDYLVTARVLDKSADVRPFAGTQRFEPGAYQSQWVVKTTPASIPKGKGLPLTPVAQRVRDWFAQVAQTSQLRGSYSDGGQGIEDFMRDSEPSGRALLMLGSKLTQSGQCAILLVHADELHPFTAAPGSGPNSACQADTASLSYGGAGSKVVRAERIGRLLGLTVADAQGFDPGAPFKVDVAVQLDKPGQERLALRLTLTTGKSTFIQRLPLALKPGRNQMTLSFNAMQGLTPTPIAGLQGKPSGPFILVADVTYFETTKAHLLLTNSVAVLVGQGSKTAEAPRLRRAEDLVALTD